jgi:hypothetical protein
VDAGVLVKLGLLLETLLADSANERFLTRVGTQMVEHITFLVKLFLAGVFTAD